MIRATSVIRRDQVDSDRVVDVITLDHGDRHRRRIALTADGGTRFLLDLEEASFLDDGDAVALETGWLVEVRASSEELLEVVGRDPLHLSTLAWHIGNRHVPAEITRDAIYIGDDHVLASMLEGLGATVRIVRRSFRPVRGAYHQAGGGHHGHAHEARHGHGHRHG